MTLSVEEISDRIEIEQLLIRYCHAIDQHDWDGYRAVYTEDAVIDDVSAGPDNSVDEMVEFLASALEKVVLIQHAISTSLIEIDGDTATARTICHCPVVLDRGDGRTETFFHGLWYADELVRTPDGWKIAKRTEQELPQHASGLPLRVANPAPQTAHQRQAHIDEQELRWMWLAGHAAVDL
jgi:3-phenylpropionate/cinnamic acid dioxygenase small subunit